MLSVQTINIVAVAVTTDVQTALHQHARRLADEYATDSLPHTWCCDPSRITPLSVATSSGWRHINTHVLIGNVGDGSFQPPFINKKA